MLKTGQQHISSLQDGRQVYLDGGLAGDVTVNPAYRNAVQSVAKIYDFQSAPENVELMTYEIPGKGGERANRIWQLPKSHAELVERRKALEAWTELHGGFLGRAPDHVASCIAGMYMGREVFEDYDPKRAKALSDYYEYARDNELYLTYVIINPQADRSKAAHEQADPFLSAGVVDQDAEGLTIRGAKMLATGGILANEVFVTCIQPLREGEEPYAVSFAIPMNARGLKILSRKSYEAAATSTFDNPLASRFDENDAVLYFDDVKVPWDRVFINQDIAMTAKQFHATPAHVYQNYQAQIRLMVKMRFLMGIAKKTAETNGVIGFPQVRETLGQLAAQNAMVDALVHAMEVKGTQRGEYFIPDRHTLYAAQVLTQQMYNGIIGTLRDLAGGGLIMLPSSIADFANPEMRALIGKTQQSPTTSSEGRVKFFKLAWDAVGSEFASRHTQYEMFYAGATFVTKGHSFRTFDWDRCTGLVDRMLDSYDLDDELAQLATAAE
ncbi:4-hydroxyphenylacetate 3-hydroxylase family protein [Pseudodonghicola flavimaris]|uniref:4-hydroxyphenylacetate 3-hydroxylase N-terminal domain-containing protein n=1 Tax=Pseudodonghicola flavimaris TaxID=3050036 RepID=A0ABT7F2L4_9RHOB|nr:4-hydroxyphenylacetate 3-hydroxylase N-terminal domain-containing protein [Pseudodonghicola flavimaris]MDK3018862.1 4-hydroxyphenylacetate 3-hydroxylase N-terminal domain-containing protein [Pseudodonghicola flavimaris]